VLQWLTGNIGLHHIHHLRPKIPNYWLQRCFDEVKAMQAVPPLTLPNSLKSLRMNLWDESAQKLVSFRSLAKSARATT
jgi:omega-6 fatty acid desaturase (delta-12 desaturase)